MICRVKSENKIVVALKNTIVHSRREDDLVWHGKGEVELVAH